MSHLASPLVNCGASQKPKSTIQVGDLVTVTLFGGKESGARITRKETCTAFVKLAGIDVPSPYQVGNTFPLDWEKVTDW